MKYEENAEIVRNYLDANDWHYEIKEHDEAISFVGGLESGSKVFKSFRFQLLVEDGYVQNFVVLPVGAGEKKAQIAEFIARVNYPLKRARMDLDYRDGEIRCHHNVPIAAVKQDPETTLEDVLFVPAALLSRYADGIAKILFGDEDPETAYEECDGASK